MYIVLVWFAQRLGLWFLETPLLSTILAYVIAMVIEFLVNLIKIWQSRKERPPTTTNSIDRALLVARHTLDDFAFL